MDYKDDDAGLYKIISKATGKFYIGSTKNFKKRKLTHFREMATKKGHNNKWLQKEYDLYGRENLAFEPFMILTGIIQFINGI